MNPDFLQHDNLDDRREILKLLERLPRRWRLRWLQWCCDSVPGPVRPGVGFNHSGLAMEVYLDLWRLATQYDLNVEIALAKLVETAKVAPPKSRDSDEPLPIRLG